MARKLHRILFILSSCWLFSASGLVSAEPASGDSAKAPSRNMYKPLDQGIEAALNRAVAQASTAAQTASSNSSPDAGDAAEPGSPAATEAPAATQASGTGAAAVDTASDRQDGLAGAPDLLPKPQYNKNIAVVEVQGIRTVPWRSYAQMRKALAAFQDAAARHAPTAKLIWWVRPAGPEPLPRNLNLRLAAGERETAIPIAHDLRFDLPIWDPYDKNTELVLNVRASRVLLGYDVVTPGLPPNTLRMGDLRALCAAYWVLETEKAREFAHVIWRDDPCEQPRIRWWFSAPSAVRDPVAILVWPKGALPLSRRGRRDFIVPLHLRRVPDDAEVRFVERAALAPPGASSTR